MEHSYLLQEDAHLRLQAGFAQAKKSLDYIPYEHGFFSNDDVASGVREMKEAGYFRALAAQYPAIMEQMKQGVNALFTGKESIWSIDTSPTKTIMPASVEEILLYTGAVSSCILKDPETAWSASKTHGFENPIDFVGSLGVYLLDNERRLGRSSEAQTYVCSHPDGKKIETELTGDMHGDLRIRQTDITEYATVSPLGLTSSFRPVNKGTTTYLSPYHSTEPALFSILLKYGEQIGRKEECRQVIESIFSESLKKPQTCGPFGDFGIQDSFTTSLVLFDHQESMPLVREVQRASGSFCLYSNSGGGYQAHIGESGELSFTRYSKTGELLEDTGVRFFPEDLELTFKALFAHAQNGTGRTSLRNLIQMYESYISEAWKN